MVFSHTYRLVPFARIHDSKQWCIHSFLGSEPSTPLIDSITRVGVLHPPTLIEQEYNTFDIVSGRQRLECLDTYCRQSQCYCLILPESSSSQQILQHLLEDQTSTAPLSLVEQAFFLKLCLQLVDKEEVVDIFFPLMGLQPNFSILQGRLQVVELGRSILKAIHFGIISDKILYEFLKLQPADQRLIKDLFTYLQMGGNKQRRFLSLCKDHMMNACKTLQTLLAEEELQHVINHSEMNSPQKCNQLLNILQNRCFPLHSSAMEKFRQEIMRLHLPKNCDLSHSPAFEKDEVHLSIRFDNFASCKKIIPSLLQHLDDSGQ